jgi:hypothetical protein
MAGTPKTRRQGKALLTLRGPNERAGESCTGSDHQHHQLAMAVKPNAPIVVTKRKCRICDEVFRVWKIG